MKVHVSSLYKANVYSGLMYDFESASLLFIYLFSIRWEARMLINDILVKYKLKV